MTSRVVMTQEELNKAITDKVDWIEIHSPEGVGIEVRACGSSTVTAHDSSTVTAYGSSMVTACGSSTVRACDSSMVTACGSSTVRACDSSTVTACDSSTVRACDSSMVAACGSSMVTAYDSSTVTAYGSSTVTAYDSSTVRACGSSTVRVCDSSTVRACDSSTVTACDSSTVRAYGSSTVTAYDSSTVRACGSSTVRVCDSSTVTACDSSTVRAYGSSTVRATPLVAVHLHSATVSLKGGVILDHTKVNANALDAKGWCEYHGVEVKRGIATLYKAVNDQWTTSRGSSYVPGTKPSCDDFKDTDECGYGLHFGPTPVHAQAYFNDATKFIAVGVKLSELRPITGGTAKAKAPRVVRACVEVDIHGNRIHNIAGLPNQKGHDCGRGVVRND